MAKKSFSVTFTNDIESISSMDTLKLFHFRAYCLQQAVFLVVCQIWNMLFFYAS